VQRISKLHTKFFTQCIPSYYLRVVDFGILSFVLAFTGIFDVFVDLGLRQLRIRKTARNKSLTSKHLGDCNKFLCE